MLRGAVVCAAVALLAGPPAGGWRTWSAQATPERVTVAAVGLAPSDLASPSARASIESELGRVTAAGARFVAISGPIGPFEDTETIPGPSTEWIGAIARGLGIVVATAVFERRPEAPNEPYLTVVLVDRDGTVAYRTRTVLPMPGLGDRRMVRGNYREPLRSIEIGGVRVGILSSSDWISGLPRLSDRGADIVLMIGAITLAQQRAELARSAQAHNLHLVVANTHGGDMPAFVVTRDGRIHEPSGNRVLADLEPSARSWRAPSDAGLPRTVPEPNRRAGWAPIVDLGRRLFIDPALSSNGAVSCATCHRPEQAFANGKAEGEGVYGRRTKRNVPSLLNVAFRPLLRWDGYASSLENFVKYPISGKSEMDAHQLDKVVERVVANPSLRQAFTAAFGTADTSFEQIEWALSAYMRTLSAGSAPFDRYLAGDQAAMPPSAVRGLALFTGKGRCAECHNVDRYENLLTDHDFHDLGVGWDEGKAPFRDTGLEAISTQALSGRFLTPSLRDVARTAPYMHDGSIATLREVVEFLDRGGNPSPGRDPLLRPLGLTAQEKSDLVSFLEQLSSNARWDENGRRIEASAQAN